MPKHMQVLAIQLEMKRGNLQSCFASTFRNVASLCENKFSPFRGGHQISERKKIRELFYTVLPMGTSLTKIVVAIDGKVARGEFDTAISQVKIGLIASAIAA